MAGAVEFDGGGLLGYWADAGYVDGDERVELDEDDGDESGDDEDEGDEEEEGEAPDDPRIRDGALHQDVRGWGMDVGATILLPLTGEPRVTLAYARGSGDKNTGNDVDRGFRQTGLHGNEPGFGGVERFQGYGEGLDPELSNMSIYTVGLGFFLFDASSIDFAYHEYILLDRAESLRDSRIDAELTGEHRDLGRGIDVIIGLEEWETLQFEISASAFRAGRAFGSDEGDWVIGAFGAVKYAF